jgi:colanic acid/amylovoran biosynthesis glycosyltransferase
MNDSENENESPCVGYLVNTYPTPSGTFIRNEIRAHEEAGHGIVRYSIRRWQGTLVDRDDIEERSRTRYLLEYGFRALISSALREAASNPTGMLRACLSTLGLALRPGGRHFFNFAYLLEAVQLKALAAIDGVTHIHAHYSTNSATVAFLAYRLNGPSFSFTVHGPDELPLMRSNGIVPKLRFASFVVAITKYTRDRILKVTPGELAEKVHVVRCGVRLSQFQPSYLFSDENHRLACIGRLCPQKAQTELVAALAELKQTYPNARLVLIGDGEAREEIAALIDRHRLQDTVYLHGWGTGEEVRAEIARSRALVLPSHSEGLPIVLMEAMALGRPVVSTSIAGIPELLDAQCGWIVPPSDHDALVKALEACLSASPDTLSDLGREGRSRIERGYNQANNAAQLRALFPKSDLFRT